MWNVLDQSREWFLSGHSLCLITIIDTKGSTYRRLGTKMIVRSDGECYGTISGGCLERDVVHHALECIKTWEQRIVSYELDDDYIVGLGLGCGGRVSLLLEPVEQAWFPILLQEKVETVLVKVIASEYSQLHVGTQYVFRKDQIIWGKIDTLQDEYFYNQCNEVLSRKTCLLNEIDVYGKRVKVFYDYIPAVPQLILFGGGEDAIPVSMFAKQLEFNVVIVDHRSVEYLAERFPGCTVIHWEGIETIEKLKITNRTAVVIMSHHIERDTKALGSFIQTDAFYIGLLGPRNRFERMITEFSNIGRHTFETDERIFSPVGLDIGSETPHEIACSILSEILAVRSKHMGGSLRERNGGIHQDRLHELRKKTVHIQ